MNWVKTILISCLAFSISFQGFAQSKDADPKAKKILDQLQTKYEAYEAIEVIFDLVLNLPDEDEDIQKGTLIQKGDQYMVDMPQQALYNNGEILWVHIKNNHEVQINDVEEEAAADILSPKDLLKIYDSEEYIYALTGKEKIDGINAEKIEFKPTDPDSEYSKIKMLINKNAKELLSVKVFSKDGSTYELLIRNIKTDLTYTESIFNFDPSKYPDIHIEDLRID